MGTSESRRAKRKVDQFDINGVLIKTYNSLSEASEAISRINATKK